MVNVDEDLKSFAMNAEGCYSYKNNSSIQISVLAEKVVGGGLMALLLIFTTDEIGSPLPSFIGIMDLMGSCLLDMAELEPYFRLSPCRVSCAAESKYNQRYCRLVAILMEVSCTEHGLPPDSENTDTLPIPLIEKLRESSLSLKPYFDKLILDLTKQQGQPPLCIISDIFFGWTVDIANDMNIFHAIFNSGEAYGMGVYYSAWINPPHTKTDSDEITLPDFPEVSSFDRSQLPDLLRHKNGMDSWSKYIRKYLPLWFKSDGILLNTIEELDQTGLKYFRRNFGGRPVWPILPAFMYQKKFTSDDGVVHCIRSQHKSGIDPEKCIEWLDNCSENSVLFVSFGSQNTISSSQMMELAIGLETSGKNFIWVVRPPVEFDISERVQIRMVTNWIRR
ncbi:Glycosyltransferase [Thalictrum thalictroides]|uniref:Glycosyltransferase n=1 Tax=Thalictrum thalictroides TaxID=46969 RepID=A0A7J6UY58_THATH|nr:Glycosyltransferase [Thalictrum thalictroides]